MKKNIAILIWSLSSGGAERIAGLLSKFLSDRYNVYLFMTDCDKVVYDYGGTIVDITQSGDDYVNSVRDLKKRYKIDCAISFIFEMNCLNIRSRGTETVIISNRSSYGEMVPVPEGITHRIKLWYNMADKIISCAYGAQYDLFSYFGINEELIDHIYNFIDKKKIINNSTEDLPEQISDFKGSSKLILNVGRLEQQKNQKKMLTQFSKLLNMGYDVKLLIVGSGSLESELKSYAEALDINDKVRFETYCKNPFPFYKLADVLAVSTESEGLPNVILEAMALGLPTVSTDCLSGPRELLNSNTDYKKRTKGVGICKRGILVEKTDSDTSGETSYLANGIKLLLDDNELSRRLSENCIEYMSHYTNEDILRKWIDVIENTEPRQDIIFPDIFTSLKNENNVIVYGAGKIGKLIMRCIINLGYHFDSFCYAVTDINNNPKDVEGIPVFAIQDLIPVKERSIVIVGVSPQYEEEVCEKLDNYGFRYMYSDI